MKLSLCQISVSNGSGSRNVTTFGDRAKEAKDNAAKKLVEWEIDKEVETVCDKQHRQTDHCVGVEQRRWFDKVTGQDVGQGVWSCAEYVQETGPDHHEGYISVRLVGVDWPGVLWSGHIHRDCAILGWKWNVISIPLFDC